MFGDKDALLQIIDQEIVEREDTASHYEPTDNGAIMAEVEELKKIRAAVQDEQPLEFARYIWVADLIATYAELVTRDSELPL